MNINLGALRLATAVLLVDLVLLLLLIGLVPATRGSAGWLEGAVIIVGYRVASGQPLFLLGLLRLLKQQLDDFSPTLVMMVSFVTSIVSAYTIGLILGSLTHGRSGAGIGQVVATANEFLQLLFTEPPRPGNPMFLLLVLQLSPWLVLAARSAWHRLIRHWPVLTDDGTRDR